MPVTLPLFPFSTAFRRTEALFRTTAKAPEEWTRQFLRLSTCAFIVAAFPAAASSQTRPPHILEDAFSCASVSEVVARAACYDAAIGTLQDAYRMGDIVVLDREAMAFMQRDAFGSHAPEIAAASAPHRLVAPSMLRFKVARVTFREGGRRTYAMSDGQVWTEVEAESGRAPSEGELVTIRRAALGSFLLFPEHGRARRVRRES